MPDDTLPAVPDPPLSLSQLGTPAFPAEVDDILDDYRKKRAEMSAKFGGMLPIADGTVEAIQMAQQGDDMAIRITIKCKTLDQIALMAAPNHHMKVVLFEDRRDK